MLGLSGNQLAPPQHTEVNKVLAVDEQPWVAELNKRGITVVEGRAKQQFIIYTQLYCAFMVERYQISPSISPGMDVFEYKRNVDEAIQKMVLNSGFYALLTSTYRYVNITEKMQGPIRLMLNGDNRVIWMRYQEEEEWKEAMKPAEETSSKLINKSIKALYYPVSEEDRKWINECLVRIFFNSPFDHIIDKMEKLNDAPHVSEEELESIENELRFYFETRCFQCNWDLTFGLRVLYSKHFCTANLIKMFLGAGQKIKNRDIINSIKKERSDEAILALISSVEKFKSTTLKKAFEAYKPGISENVWAELIDKTETINHIHFLIAIGRGMPLSIIQKLWCRLSSEEKANNDNIGQIILSALRNHLHAREITQMIISDVKSVKILVLFFAIRDKYPTEIIKLLLSACEKLSSRQIEFAQNEGCSQEIIDAMLLKCADQEDIA